MASLKSKLKARDPSKKRMKVWVHNSFSGHARMMHSQATNIIAAETTTSEAKRIAERIQELSMDLIQELKIRIDLPEPLS